MGVEVTTLGNGLTIATETMPQLESASVGVWVNAGARSEAAEEHGISHLLEHMAFKGTQRRTARQIAEEIEAVGGEINAATSVEHTNYYARVLKDDIPLALDILSDILTDSVFDADELQREQHVILQEIGAAHDTPEDHVFDLLQESAFPGQPIGRPILGTPETVSSFGPDAIRAYLNRHYRGPNMVVAAAGKLEHAEIVALAEARFSGLAGDRIATPEPARYAGGESREERELQEAQITLAFEGRAHGSADQYGAQVLSAALGGGMSSRLFQEVREKLGLCYSISAFHWGYRETGLFGIHAATGEADVDRLVPVMIDEIERIGRDLDEAEVARAKAQMRAGLLMSLESPTARASQIARQILIYGRPLTVDEITAKIAAVSVRDVRRLAGEIFRDSAPTVALIGPVAGAPGAGEVARRLTQAKPAA
ncbi:M16 family metallopeptidase [Methyloraptor flagellatus]|jgi:predicted Zn-dependent peptidase|uniref:Pitrilysin family protein n=1 Tax=Methyloraptor flagellatus TaxID=3162530 RepID=A0AAU7X5C8_9HYPH